MIFVKKNRFYAAILKREDEELEVSCLPRESVKQRK